MVKKKILHKLYDYKLGELRGMIHFKISDNGTFKEPDETFYIGILTKVITFIILIYLLYYLISSIRKNKLEYTTNLENIAHQWRQHSQ